MADISTVRPRPSPPRGKKNRRIPAALEDLPRIFDDKFFRDLARAKLLPAEVDMPCFAAAVLEAARIYVRDAGAATGNEVHHEVAQVLRAAERAMIARKRPDVAYENVAVLLEELSEQTRKLLRKRGALPDAATVRNPATQREACETIARLCRIGARWQEGRRRPGGKRSMTMVSELHAPALQQHPERHQPQLNFAIWFRAAYLEAVGKQPPFTAHPGRPSRFAQVMQACLDKLGAAVNAVELINKLQRGRNKKERQLRERLSGQNS